MNRIPEIFSNPPLKPKRLKELQALPDPRKRYVIAMTPRSGSSYLCDVMAKVNRFGAPGEMLNQDFVPGILKNIPGRTPDEYLRHVLRAKKTRNNISGLKASWFQYENFISAMQEPEWLLESKFIYLTRRDLAAQAVSLYKATATSVFHTNKAHDESALKKLASLDYDFNEIDRWYQHIAIQERGWQAYFAAHRIFPLCITYEDIEEDILAVLRRIGAFLGIKQENIALPDEASVFSKVGDIQNIEWASRFVVERARRMEQQADAPDSGGVLGRLRGLRK